MKSMVWFSAESANLALVASIKSEVTKIQRSINGSTSTSRWKLNSESKFEQTQTKKAVICRSKTLYKMFLIFWALTLVIKR